jgi:integrase
MTESIRTWGAAVDYTFRTRVTWKRGNGAKTAAINCGHFTRLRGRSFPLASINEPCMALVASELEDEGKSDATINRIVSAVSTVMNHLAFDGVIHSAPKFRRRKEVEHRINFFTKEEVDSMIQVATDVYQNNDLRDIILFASYTGMRTTEILTLKPVDIDLGLNIIHVGGRPGFTTKAANYRSIPIHDRIKDALCSRMESCPSGRALFGNDWTGKDQLLRSFKKVRGYIGKDESYVFYTLRHSFATWAIDAGVGIRVVMELMGHKRVETTLRYAKVSNKARSDAILAI